MPIKGVQKGKSVWQGQGEEAVNVETYALQHYERLGYKGYHCEGRIVTTLFGLLFWDIIFTPIPGAFETPYQTAPLDIFEDTFYHAREGLIEKRLDEISGNNSRKIIEKVDDEHRERGTWCMGVRWDLFPKEDLLEIVEVSTDFDNLFKWMTFVQCFKGEALACLCRVLCEDYAQRGSGVPDLFIWNYAEKHCKFVEVKGPGDRLQENQKVRVSFGTSSFMCGIQVFLSALDRRYATCRGQRRSVPCRRAGQVYKAANEGQEAVKEDTSHEEETETCRLRLGDDRDRNIRVGR